MSSLNNVPPFSKNIGDIKIQYMTNSTLVSSVKMEYGFDIICISIFSQLGKYIKFEILQIVSPS